MASDRENFNIPLIRKRVNYFSKCIICQIDLKKESLRRAKESSVQTFVRAVQIRKDEVHDRLSSELADLSDRELQWHSSCYASYTSEHNLRHSFPNLPARDQDVADVMNDGSEEANIRLSTRSSSQPTDWSKCFICGNKSYKKDKQLLNISTFEACTSVKNAAASKGDERMLRLLSGAKHDLIAVEGKYHKNCFASYVSKTNLKHQGFVEEEGESVYDAAFQELASEIGEGIEQGKAYDMITLLSKYCDCLKEREVDGSSYSKQRLKLRLKKHFDDRIVFYQQPSKSKPEVIFSSKISLLDALNSFARPKRESSENRAEHIVEVARWLRSDIKKCKGISFTPLNVNDVSLDSARRVIPDSLYWMVRLLVTTDETGSENLDSLNPCKRKDEEKRVLSIAQDIIHCSTNSRTKLPKHISLAMTVHHLTGSKLLVSLLNRMGHSSSYDDLKAVDTSLAMEVMAKSEQYGTVVPSIISQGAFVQLAADNNDLNEETLDGKNTTHATTMVVFQRKVYGPDPPPSTMADHSKRRRSMPESANLYELLDCQAYGRRPAVTEYVKQVKNEWFSSQLDILSKAVKDDDIWLLLRMNLTSIAPATVPATVMTQSVPGWSGFNAILYPDLPPSSNIGYCPMINGASTDFSTVYTVLKHSQKISAFVGQADAVITFDLAIYVKAKQIQMRYPQEFANTVIRLGGFHIALNFLSLLGKKFMSSGLDDLLIESGVYAAGTTSALLKGKSYNRGVRAHKLSMEAFHRMMWIAFVKWCNDPEKSNEQMDSHDTLGNKLEACRQSIKSKDNISQMVGELEHDMQKIAPLLEEFKAETSSQSKTFSFWEQYISMVKLLLQFIKAERTGNWNLHLASTAAMIPHFFSMDRPNYSRWLPVYISDMKQLPVKHPNVHQEFVAGNHAVSRSGQPFSQVWTDMALEQSVNADSKLKGGIVGISQNPSALQRWFLTCHERASVTTALKDAYSLQSDRVYSHKESSSKRLARDEADVKKLINCFTSGLMNSPFEHDSDTLVNFATGVVLPTEVANSLVKSPLSGHKQMSVFIKERLESNKVSFWDPIPKLNIKSFSNVNKKVQVKATNEKLVTVGSDRDLFGRLLIAANVRQVDLKEVLAHELSSVPYALAHQDGSLRKTNKSALAGILEAGVDVCRMLPISMQDTIHLIDAMALVQTLRSGGSNTFGALVQKYYPVIVAPLNAANCNEVHLVFDQYWEISIKAGERYRRCTTASVLEIEISGPATPVPKQWGKYISNQRNKINLCDFLTSSLTELGMQQLPVNKRLVIGGGYRDGIRAVSVTSGHCEDVTALRSDHEEADTRLFLHAKHVTISHPRCRVVVHSPDTDVFVLGVTHFERIGCKELWLKTGVKDHLRFIPLHDVAQKLGNRICNALLGFHAISGCDSTSSLNGIGKKKAWDILQSSVEHQESLGSLGTRVRLGDATEAKCETYVCNLYPCQRKPTSTDELRYFLFCQKKQKNERLPPTSNSLRHHLRRTNYQALIWRRSLDAMQELPRPEDNGWERSANELKPVLMSKNPAPSSLLELTTCSCKSGCQRNCSCNNNGLSCTESCHCMADTDCRNQHTVQLVDCISDSDDSDSE